MTPAKATIVTRYKKTYRQLMIVHRLMREKTVSDDLSALHFTLVSRLDEIERDALFGDLSMAEMQRIRESVDLSLGEAQVSEPIPHVVKAIVKVFVQRLPDGTLMSSSQIVGEEPAPKHGVVGEETVEVRWTEEKVA